MKSLIFAAVACAAVACAADVSAYDPSRPFETIDEARMRHSAERYNTYEQRGYQSPLGGYRERLGDQAPPGTATPGMTDPWGYGDSQYPGMQRY